MLESISLRMYEPSSQRLFRYAQEARGYVHAANSKNYFSHEETKSKLISDGSGSFVIISEFTARPTFYINPKERAAPLA